MIDDLEWMFQSLFNSKVYIEFKDGGNGINLMIFASPLGPLRHLSNQWQLLRHMPLGIDQMAFIVTLHFVLN